MGQHITYLQASAELMISGKKYHKTFCESSIPTKLFRLIKMYANKICTGKHDVLPIQNGLQQKNVQCH